MTDPRNVHHDKRVKQEKKHRGLISGRGSDAAHRPGMKPHQQRLPAGHGPDADEPIDQVENPVENPVEQQH